jgi:hypothetical protein
VANMLRACGEHVATNIQTSCCEHFFHVANNFSYVANNFSHVANTFSHVAPPPSSPDIVYILRAMLRACSEHVASKHQMQSWWAVGRASDFSPVERLIRSITVSSSAKKMRQRRRSSKVQHSVHTSITQRAVFNRWTPCSHSAPNSATCGCRLDRLDLDAC